MKWLYWVVGIVAVVMLGWFVLFPRYWIPFKVTVVVETPEGERSGSSIIAIQCITDLFLLRMDARIRAMNCAPRGVAPVVDLGKRGLLVAALGRSAKPCQSKTAPDGRPYSRIRLGNAIIREYLPDGEFSFDELPWLYWYVAKKGSASATRFFPQFFIVDPNSRNPSAAQPVCLLPSGPGIDGIRLKSISYAPNQSDAVIEEFDPAPPWVQKIRETTKALKMQRPDDPETLFTGHLETRGNFLP